MKKALTLILMTQAVAQPLFAQQEKTEISRLREVPARSISSQAQDAEKQTNNKVDASPVTRLKKKRFLKTQKEPVSLRLGNLPNYALRSGVESLETVDGSILTNKNAKYPTPVQIYMGDILRARINQDLVGYEGAQSPVKAILRDGQYRGATLIGNATLDKKTKSVLVSFTHIRTADGEYQISGTLHSVTGELGLKGQYSSNYWGYFWAHVLAGGVSGYANALTERKRSVLGFTDIVPTPDAAAHQAVANAAASTADLFAERAKEAPEFSVVEGPVDVSIFITKEPTNTQEQK